LQKAVTKFKLQLPGKQVGSWFKILC